MNARLVFAFIALVAVGMQVGTAQAPAPKTLTTAQSFKCNFTLVTVGNWDKAGTPTAETAPAKLAMQFVDIDTQDGTANVVEVSTVSAGAPHIIVRLMANNLHFLAMNTSGSVYLTTVFADKESAASGKFKAAHSRHEFTPVRLSSWTSRPEQYVGYCE